VSRHCRSTVMALSYSRLALSASTLAYLGLLNIQSVCSTTILLATVYTPLRLFRNFASKTAVVDCSKKDRELLRTRWVTSVLLRENALPHKSQLYLRVDAWETELTRGLPQSLGVVSLPSTDELLTVNAGPWSSWTLEASFAESSSVSRYGRNNFEVLAGEWSASSFFSSFRCWCCCWWWFLVANKSSCMCVCKCGHFQTSA